MHLIIFQTGEPLQIDSHEYRPMRAINLSKMLLKYGHTVDIISSDFFHQEKRKRTSKQTYIEYCQGLNIHLIPSCGYTKNISLMRFIDHAILAFNLFIFLRRNNFRADACFIGFPPIEAAFVISAYMKKRGVPIILDAKDQWPDIFIEKIPSKFTLLGKIILTPYFYMARSVFRNADIFCSMSKSYLNWMKDVAGDCRNRKELLVPLTAPMQVNIKRESKGAKEWWLGTCCFDASKTNIVFIGSISQAFDFYKIKEAAKYFKETNKNIQFTICGDGDELNNVKKIMEKCSNVFFPGWIDLNKIKFLIEHTKVTIAPYRDIKNFSDNVPNKIIDSFSWGKPVLCSLSGETKDLILEKKVGLNYSSSEELIAGIEKLLNDDKYYNKMVENCLMLYKNQFDYEFVYKNLIDSIEKYCAQ